MVGAQNNCRRAPPLFNSQIGVRAMEDCPRVERIWKRAGHGVVALPPSIDRRHEVAVDDKAVIDKQLLAWLDGSECMNEDAVAGFDYLAVGQTRMVQKASTVSSAAAIDHTSVGKCTRNRPIVLPPTSAMRRSPWRTYFDLRLSPERGQPHSVDMLFRFCRMSSTCFLA